MSKTRAKWADVPFTEGELALFKDLAEVRRALLFGGQTTDTYHSWQRIRKHIHDEVREAREQRAGNVDRASDE